MRARARARARAKEDKCARDGNTYRRPRRGGPKPRQPCLWPPRATHTPGCLDSGLVTSLSHAADHRRPQLPRVQPSCRGFKYPQSRTSAEFRPSLGDRGKTLARDQKPKRSRVRIPQTCVPISHPAPWRTIATLRHHHPPHPSTVQRPLSTCAVLSQYLILYRVRYSAVQYGTVLYTRSIRSLSISIE